MTAPAHPSRRALIAGGAAAASALVLPALARAQGILIPTPAQTAGPFYPETFPADADNDLVVLRGSAARAQGTVAHIRGRVLGLDGRPVAGARVEIWQCDARGRYLHRLDQGSRPRDTAFQGTAAPCRGPTAPTPSAPSGPSPIRAARPTSTSR
jgi:protocatechuate 3,4-dioxygenase beta subunit